MFGKEPEGVLDSETDKNESQKCHHKRPECERSVFNAFDEVAEEAFHSGILAYFESI